MTFLVDVAGMQGLGLMCYGEHMFVYNCMQSEHPKAHLDFGDCTGGEEERWAQLQGLPPPVSAYRPAMNNIAPRADAWAASRSNTQTPPLQGPVSEADTAFESDISDSQS